MNPPNPNLHQLSQQQLAVLRAVLAPFADRIELVGIFGSRATGMARPNSDIDLVLYGDVEAAVVDRLRPCLAKVCWRLPLTCKPIRPSPIPP